MEIKQPHEALRRLDGLVGEWALMGRSMKAAEDDISGWVVIEWLPGGYFMQQRGEITVGGFTGQSLEILSHDPETDTFPSMVYSSMSGVPLAYAWDVQGDVVTHWTEGAKYTGRFSEDGRELIGGWRPDDGVESHAGNHYDATMTRVK